MEEQLRKKLEHYMMNSGKFLWGTGGPRQKRPGMTYQNTYYDCVRANGFDFDNGTYSRVSEYLILRYGMEQILEKHVIKSIKEKFPEETIDKLREYWLRGYRPSLSEINELPLKTDYTKKETMDKWSPFFDVDILQKRNQGQLEYDYYVRAWDCFAGVWFEEIEPWMKSEKIG